MNILWDDAVYPHIEVAEVVNSPYRVSNTFIEAVKNVINKQFPPSLCKDDGTKILVIEKDTAIMGDLFFGHVDGVSRRLFDLSSIQDKLNSLSTMSRSLKKYVRYIRVPFSIIFFSIGIITYKKLVQMINYLILMLL
jgi:hypothetical protein